MKPITVYETHIDTYTYIYMPDSVYVYTYIHTSRYIYIHLYTYPIVNMYIQCEEGPSTGEWTEGG